MSSSTKWNLFLQTLDQRKRHGGIAASGRTPKRHEAEVEQTSTELLNEFFSLVFASKIIYPEISIKKRIWHHVAYLESSIWGKRSCWLTSFNQNGNITYYVWLWLRLCLTHVNYEEIFRWSSLCYLFRKATLRFPLYCLQCI